MIAVTCNICEAKGEKVEIKSNIIAKSDKEAMAMLGGEMLAHLQNSHPNDLREIVIKSQQTNAIMVMRHFDSLDETYNEQRELIRDQVCEAVMLGAEEDENESDETEETTDDSGAFMDTDEDEDEDLEDEPVKDPPIVSVEY